MERTSRPCVGLFGKLPWAADFVRIHHHHAGAIALDEWLTGAVQAIARAKGSWPTEVLRFVLDLGVAEHLLVGVVAPSRDRAGRGFPVAVYAARPVRDVAGRLPELCVLSDPFLAAAEDLVAEAKNLDRAQLIELLDRLRCPRVENLSNAGVSLRERLGARCGGQFADSAFGTERRHHAAGAMHRLVRAAADAAQGESERPRVLSVSGADGSDMLMFMALAQRPLRSRERVPSVMWGRASEGHRMLVALGRPIPTTLPLWWSAPKRKSDRFACLATTAPQADSDLPMRLTDGDWACRGDDFVSRVVRLSLA